MEILTAIYTFLSGQTITVPVSELALLAVLTSMFLVLGRHKLGTIVCYLFIIYWGYLANLRYFMDLLTGSTMGLMTYAFGGLIMMILLVVGFFVDSKSLKS